MNRTETAHEESTSLPAFASIIHDLRNPLTAIHGSAEMLIASELSEPQVHRIARNLYGASIRMQELLDELLSRHLGAERGVEVFDLHELVLSAVDKIALVAESQSVQITLNAPENLALAVDGRRIQRVLVNLFVNALEAMPDGGTIRISATSERDSVLIKVRDTGPGILPEIRDRLFQPFATAGKTGGIGLGLAVSRQAVVEHGGQMWVEFAGHGACFAVRLPASPGARATRTHSH